MDFRKKLLVEPGRKFKLSDIDPGFHGKFTSEEEAQPELDRLKQKLTAMQRLFYGDRNHALLIVLQGIDGAGKDGTCWHVIGAMDPQGVKVQSSTARITRMCWSSACTRKCRSRSGRRAMTSSMTGRSFSTRTTTPRS
jgi:hypothetical protein